VAERSPSDIEKVIDFAYRSEHEMTVAAKAVVNAYYGSAPKYSYWNGCSTGGRQGLAEVQRYPNDFDGVIAGAQANPRTHLNAWHLSLVNAALKDPAAFIPREKYPAIHRAVLNACDALDGVKDGLIGDPTRCHFDPQVLACPKDDGRECLTARQIETVRTLMRPAKTSRGEEVFPGYAPGTELGWGAVVGGPEPSALTIDHYKCVVFKDAAWDWHLRYRSRCRGGRQRRWRHHQRRQPEHPAVHGPGGESCSCITVGRIRWSRPGRASTTTTAW
jgi:feruloyl esterase